MINNFTRASQICQIYHFLVFLVKVRQHKLNEQEIDYLSDVDDQSLQIAVKKVESN